MREITKGLTLGTLLLSTQLLSPLAMASAELPGEGVKVQPLQAHGAPRLWGAARPGGG